MAVLPAMIAAITMLPADLALAEEAAPAVKTLNTPRDFPRINSKGEWVSRATEIRQQILVNAGLWPMPEKTPLDAHILQPPISREGYSIERVYFQSLPGFYVAGNLYRPIGKGAGPFPGVLNSHGHWENGRFADAADGSIAARCISFARQGIIAFSYDMVGYNDTHFSDSPTAKEFDRGHRHFGTNDAANQLWNVSLMGLQTWDSIRALDFLLTLPDIDTNRVAMTGESGGGTQTFMLGAVEDRLAAQAPVVMVSHTMQGGCLCENMPGLRVEYSNVEIAAAAAPRRQIVVAATGDWTKTTPTMEGPAIASVYQLFHATDKFKAVQFDFGHNYNQTSREAVYETFGPWLLARPEGVSFKEAAYTKEPDAALRVFPGDKLPEGARSEQGVINLLKERAQGQWNSLVPRDQASFEHYLEVLQPAWRSTLQVRWPQFSTKSLTLSTTAGYKAVQLELTRKGETGSVVVLGFLPSGTGDTGVGTKAVVLADPAGAAAFCDASDKPGSLVQKLLGQGRAVCVIKSYTPGPSADQFKDFYTTYNRTIAQQRVRDLILVAQAARSLSGKPDLSKTAVAGNAGQVVLWGNGNAGLWALLASPAAGIDAVIADCGNLDTTHDQNLLAADLFLPGLRNLGGFEGVAMLAAPHPMLLHGADLLFPTDRLSATYAGLNKSKSLLVNPNHMDENALTSWLSKYK